MVWVCFLILLWNAYRQITKKNHNFPMSWFPLRIIVDFNWYKLYTHMREREESRFFQIQTNSHRLYFSSSKIRVKVNKKVLEVINKPNKQLLCQTFWSVNSYSLLHLEYLAREGIFGRIAAMLPFSLRTFHPTLMSSSFSSPSGP